MVVHKKSNHQDHWSSQAQATLSNNVDSPHQKKKEEGPIMVTLLLDSSCQNGNFYLPMSAIQSSWVHCLDQCTMRRRVLSNMCHCNKYPYHTLLILQRFRCSMHQRVFHTVYLYLLGCQCMYIKCIHMYVPGVYVRRVYVEYMFIECIHIACRITVKQSRNPAGLPTHCTRM